MSSDSSVFLATIYKGLELYRNIPGGTALGLVHIMMRDGTNISSLVPPHAYS